MITIKDYGSFEKVPQIVTDIAEGNTAALDAHLHEGWEIKKRIIIEKGTAVSPIEIAILTESIPSLSWLAEHGADLNDKDNPSFCIAVRYCGKDVICWMAEHGADVNLTCGIFGEAYKQALFGKKKENLQLIEDLGHSVKKYGGQAFRSAVDTFGKEADFEVLDFFIRNGVDINYNKPDMVYPFKPTPLCVAARYADIDMCKYLVSNGADVTMAEKGGMRPYTIALERGDPEMAAFFKSLEPPELHSPENKLSELKPYKLPQPLLDFLQGDNLRLDLTGKEYDVSFIEFFSLVDTVLMKAGQLKVVRLSKEVDNYSHIIIVWNPRSKKIAYWDMEHEELGNIATFECFIKEAGEYMQKVIDGDL